MNRTKHYTDLKGRTYALADLDVEERQLLDKLVDSAAKRLSWNEYSNLWMAKVGALYESRGMNRQATQKTIVYRIARDLGSRLAIAEGKARAPDYRDDLEELIRTRYRTRREFCEATGLSEDMLSHVLAKRKHLAVDTLSEALERIGYTLHIAPLKL